MISEEKIDYLLQKKEKWFIEHPDAVEKWWKRKKINDSNLSYRVKRDLLSKNYEYYKLLPSIHNDVQFAEKFINGKQERYDLFTNLKNNIDVQSALVTTVDSDNPMNYLFGDSLDLPVRYYFPGNYEKMSKEFATNKQVMKNFISAAFNNYCDWEKDSRYEDVANSASNESALHYFSNKYPEEYKEACVDFAKDLFEQNPRTYELEVLVKALQNTPDLYENTFSEKNIIEYENIAVSKIIENSESKENATQFVADLERLNAYELSKSNNSKSVEKPKEDKLESSMTK